MRETFPYVEEYIPEKTHKRLHLIYFTVKMLLIGMIVFSVIQGIAMVAVVDDLSSVDGGNEFVSHTYCGTFFIDMNAENSFTSEEAAQKFLQGTEKSIAENIVVTAMSVVLLICTFLALRNGDKKVVFSRNTPRLFLAAGIVYALGNVWLEYKNYSETKLLQDSFAGIFSTWKYYCQLYDVLAIPVIIFCCGLVLRQHERKLHHQSTKEISLALKATAIATLIPAFGFILYRFGVRVYELIRTLSGAKISVRLPFYNMLLELPYELAKTPSDYTNLILFRFVKDLPVFIASAITVILFSMVLFSASKDEINTTKNRKRITVSIIALIISSILFNVLGLFEVNMLNQGFTGIYGNVTYTIGLRANCEPMLYAMVLWFFSTYMQCVPKSQI